MEGEDEGEDGLGECGDGQFRTHPDSGAGRLAEVSELGVGPAEVTCGCPGG